MRGTDQRPLQFSVVSEGEMPQAHSRGRSAPTVEESGLVPWGREMRLSLVKSRWWVERSGQREQPVQRSSREGIGRAGAE